MFLNCQKFWFPTPTWIQDFWIREWRPISPSVISNTAQFRRTWTSPLGKVRLQREEKWTKRAKGVHFYSHKNSCPCITTPRSPASDHLTRFIISALCISLLVPVLRNLPNTQVWASCFPVWCILVVTPSWSVQYCVTGPCVLFWPSLQPPCLRSPRATLRLPTLSDSLWIPALSSLDAKPEAFFPSCLPSLPQPALLWVLFHPLTPSYSVSLIRFSRPW